MTRQKIALFLVILLLAALPVAAMAQGIQGNDIGPGGIDFNTLYHFFMNTSVNLSNIFIGWAKYILTACVAIRFLALVIPAMLEGDLASMAKDLIYLGVMVAILVTALAAWNGQGGPVNIRQTVDNAAGEFITAAGQAANVGGQYQGPADILDYTGNAMLKTLSNEWKLAMTFPSVSSGNGPGSGTHWWDKLKDAITDEIGVLVSMPGTIFAFLIALITMIVTVISFFALMVETGIGWAYIIIPLTFGPLALAFYPLIPGWTRNLVSQIAGAIATLAAAAFVIACVVQMTNLMTQQLTNYINNPTMTISGVFTWAATIGTAKPILELETLLIVGVSGLIGYHMISAAAELFGATDHARNTRNTIVPGAGKQAQSSMPKGGGGGGGAGGAGGAAAGGAEGGAAAAEGVEAAAAVAAL